MINVNEKRRVALDNHVPYIIDPDQPRRGFIRISEDSMLRLKATIEQNTP